MTPSPPRNGSWAWRNSCNFTNFAFSFQGASQRDAATPPERDLCIEELQAELQEVELRKRALASLSHFLKAKTKVGAAPNSPAKGSKTLGPCQRGGTEPGARQGGSAGVGGQPGGVGRGRANAAGGAKVVGLERGGAPAGVLKSGVQLGGGKVGRARLAAGLKVGVTRKVTALGAVGESVAPKKLGPGAVAKGALTRKVVRIGMVQRPVLTAALAATGGTPSGPRLAAPQIAQQLLSKGDGSPARRTGPGVKKALVGGDIQRQEDGSLRRVVEASQAVVIAANRRGGLQPLVQKKVVVASPKGVSKSAAAAKTSGSVPEKGPLVQREPSVGGLQTVPPGGQQKLPRGRPQQPPGAPAVGQGSQGTSIRKKSTAPGSQGVQVTISGKVGNAGSKEQKAPSEAGKQQPGQLGRPEPGPPAQKVAPVGTRLTVPTTPSTSVTPNGKLAPGRMLKEPAPPPARLNPPGTKSGPNAVTKGSLQAAQLPGGPEKAAKLVAPGVNSRPKVSPPTLVRPRVVQAPKTSPTTRSPPGVTGKLQWVRPQPTPVPGSKSTDVLKRPIIAPAANAQKRTVTIASAATALKVPSFPLGAPSMSAKPGDSANPPLRGPLKAPPNSARNPVAAPPRGLAPRAPTGYPGQSYGLSRPGSNKWQRSPGTAQPIRPPVTVPQRKNLQWVRKEAQPATAVATKPGFVSNAGTSPKPSPTNKVPRATAAGVGKPGDSAGVAKVGRSIGKGEAGWKPKEKVVQGSVSPAANCVDKKIILVESKKGETAKVSLAGAELKD